MWFVAGWQRRVRQFDPVRNGFHVNWTKNLYQALAVSQSRTAQETPRCREFAKAELLETRWLPSGFEAHVNFQPPAAPVPAGYIADTGALFADQGNGMSFGWNGTKPAKTVARHNKRSPDDRYGTFAVMRPRGNGSVWEMEVPNGDYLVHIAAGDSTVARARYRIQAEGVLVVDGRATPASHWVEGTQPVTVSDGRLTITSWPHTLGNKIDFVDITPASGSGLDAGASFNWQPAADSPVQRFEGYERVYNGKLYAFGGYTHIDPFGATKSVDVYDPATNRWSHLGEMPVPETHAGVAIDQDRGAAYFIGGLRGLYPGQASTDVYKYDFKTNRWSRMPSLPEPLSAGAAEFVNGQIHYLGGNRGQDRVTDYPIHYVLDVNHPAAGWQQAAAFPNPRDHFSVVALGGKLYTMGGEIGHDTLHEQQNELRVYDPATDTWTQLADMPIARSHAESSTFVHNGKIVMAGGQIEDFKATDSIVEYDPITNTWTTLPSLPLALEGTCVQSIGDQLIVSMGYDGLNGVPAVRTWVSKPLNG